MDKRKGVILVVDDDPFYILLLSELLSAEGLAVRPADSGAQALAAVEAKIPDLILLDVVMFGMDGLEVCQRMRAEPALAKTPIVLLTVLDDAGVRDRGRELGATAIWSKPFGPEQLLERVSKLLGPTPRSAAL